MLFTLQRYEFFSKSQQSCNFIWTEFWCCLPYKGTNFSANHNNPAILSGQNSMLFTLQRYEFFSKSQHFIWLKDRRSGCCLPYKGTNFSANHNFGFDAVRPRRDVVYPTKVRIFQQITTSWQILKSYLLMLFTLQRYEFFSKSQRRVNYLEVPLGCCLPYKGTNFSANHNVGAQYYTSWVGCCLPYKGTNFSANHNYSRLL